MKRGDILICKKELENNTDMIIDNKYTIYYISHDNTYIDIEIDDNFTRRFYFNGLYNINNYFFTPEELRTIKLESL